MVRVLDKSKAHRRKKAVIGEFQPYRHFPLPLHKQDPVPTIRQQQVAELVRRNFSLVLQDQGRYIYGDVMVTVTEVQMSPDLLLAKIYLSVYNTENKQAVLLEMEDQHQELRQSLGHRLRKHIRRIPDIAFYIDDTLDEMERVDKLFKQLESTNQMGRPSGDRSTEEE